MKFGFKPLPKPDPKATPKGTGKPRAKAKPGGHSCAALGHPTCARSWREPVRLPYRDEIGGLNHRAPGLTPLEDSIDLRRRVAEASLAVANAHNAFATAVEALKALGPLPDSIIQDMSPSTRRHLGLFAQSKPQAPEVPWTVVKRVNSASRAGVVHEIREDRLHNLTCTCEGYKYQNRCWALDQVRDTRKARRGETAPEKE